MPRPPIHHDPSRAEHLAEVLKAIGHPLRLRIVSLLSTGGRHVTALAEELHAPQAIVSQQLRILRMNGLVAADRREGHATYQLAEPQLLTMLACMDRCAIPAPAVERSSERSAQP